MGHQHHSILRSNPQHVGGVGRNHHHPLSFRKPLPPRQLRPPIHHDNAPAKQCPHAHQRLRVISSAQDKQPLRSNNPFRKDPLRHTFDPALPQHSSPRFHQFSLSQPHTGEGVVSTRRKYRASQSPFLIR